MNLLEEIMKWFKELGIELVLFLAGLFGAFVNVSKDKNLTLLERLMTVISGGLVANYMTPVFMSFLKLSDKISYGLAFVLGYMGLKSVEYFIQYLHKKVKDKK